MMSPEKIVELNREYQDHGIHEHEMKSNPFEQFHQWFKEMVRVDSLSANAMVLATANAHGQCSVRTVLLKRYDDRGFVFYTNYNSDKAKEIQVNPWVAVNFHWPQLQRDIRIAGEIQKLDQETSRDYFYSRPRKSQIAAWASQQSGLLESRAALEQLFQETSALHEGQEIPYPEFWGGYLIIPQRFEFWQGRSNRLHDRIVYTHGSDSWMKQRFAP